MLQIISGSIDQSFTVQTFRGSLEAPSDTCYVAMMMPTMYSIASRL